MYIESDGTPHGTTLYDDSGHEIDAFITEIDPHHISYEDDWNYVTIEFGNVKFGSPDSIEEDT